MATLIVVEDLGAPATLNRGGQAMLLLQTLEGLRRLGHDVLFCEFVIDPSPDTVEYFTSVVSDWWLPARAALVDPRKRDVVAGVDRSTVEAAARRAAGVITLAAHYSRDPWPFLEDVRPRILIEQDPAYTHLWAAGGDPLDVFGEHDVHFTVGGNIGTPRSNIPTVGIDWFPTWNPVVLDWWPVGQPVVRDRFTTVAGWRDYGYLEFEDRVLGPKTDEFRKFLELPERVREPLEIALSADPDDPDRMLFESHGWQLVDPMVVSTPSRYRDYVWGSIGEFSCAKGGYVGTRSGWFSDRSACYLAAGRPVVLQATGFEDLLPTGEGLFAVRTVDEAAEAISAIRGDYERQSRAARQIAEDHFDSNRVLRTMLERVDL